MNNMFDKVDELRKNNWKEIIVTENDRPVCKSENNRIQISD